MCLCDVRQPVSDFYLSAFLAQLRTDHYSVFVVGGEYPPLQAGEPLEGRGEWLTEAAVAEREPAPPAARAKPGRKPPKPRGPGCARVQHRQAAGGASEGSCAQTFATAHGQRGGGRACGRHGHVARR